MFSLQLDSNQYNVTENLFSLILSNHNCSSSSILLCNCNNYHNELINITKNLCLLWYYLTRKLLLMYMQWGRLNFCLCFVMLVETCCTVHLDLMDIILCDVI
jgi:hypothetical protein